MVNTVPGTLTRRAIPVEHPTKSSPTITKSQARMPQYDPSYPSEDRTPSGAHLGSKSRVPDKEYDTYEQMHEKEDNTYANAHSQDEVQRATTSDMGPSRGLSQREIYGF
jgi:hypothetical protein